MLLIAASVLALLTPLLAGRWPAGLLMHRWRLAWLVWVALALQVVVVEVRLPDSLAPVLHVGTYVAALVFLVANRRLRGVLVVAVGATLNGLTIALNGGTLPASADAIAATGVDRDAAFANSAVVHDAVLPWLGDVFAWPAPLPLANTFSVGDIVIVLGVLVVAWAGARRIGRSPGVQDGTGPGAESSLEPEAVDAQQARSRHRA